MIYPGRGAWWCGHQLGGRQSAGSVGSIGVVGVDLRGERKRDAHARGFDPRPRPAEPSVYILTVHTICNFHCPLPPIGVGHTFHASRCFVELGKPFFSVCVRLVSDYLMSATPRAYPDGTDQNVSLLVAHEPS